MYRLLFADIQLSGLLPHVDEFRCIGGISEFFTEWGLIPFEILTIQNDLSITMKCYLSNNNKRVLARSKRIILLYY